MLCSFRSVGIISGVLGRAGERGQQRRKKDSAAGAVPWETSPELVDFMAVENKAALTKQKEVMGKLQQFQGLNLEETNILDQQRATEAAPVSEDALLDIMGQTASGETAEAVKQTEALSSVAIEAQLDAVRSSTAEVEKALKN